MLFHNSCGEKEIIIISLKKCTIKTKFKNLPSRVFLFQKSWISVIFELVITFLFDYNLIHF